MRYQSVPFNQSTAATHSVVVPEDGSRRIRLEGFLLSAGGTVTVTIQDSGGQVIAGPFSMAAQSQVTMPVLIDDNHLGQTGLGKGLDIVLSAAEQVGGLVIYSVRQEVVP